MNENEVKFHGISSPEELKQAWTNLTNRSADEIKFIWDFSENTSPYDLTQANIININQDKESTGHWCLVYKLTDDKILYYNPIRKQILKTLIDDDFLNESSHGQEIPKDEALELLLKMFDTLVDLSGEQSIIGKYSSSCGYYCLYKLREYLKQKPISQCVILFKLK